MSISQVDERFPRVRETQRSVWMIGMWREPYRTFNMCKRVVFPALSRPRNRSFACLLRSPSDARTSQTVNGSVSSYHDKWMVQLHIHQFTIHILAVCLLMGVLLRRMGGWVSFAKIEVDDELFKDISRKRGCRCFIITECLPNVLRFAGPITHSPD